ncbi:hypothetical protein Y032_0792g2378 [Ancylostoma ceylanicum]|uniref:Uncharacterized protein n=1 Tax=Ancylostoma ceylanicum TaxID=53326 RepID=A0A016WCS4_9BILA|nr:hypothetical protein Y032_0792g2378 [Ancylostoma ceylanicum]
MQKAGQILGCCRQQLSSPEKATIATPPAICRQLKPSTSRQATAQAVQPPFASIVVSPPSSTSSSRTLLLPTPRSP